MSAPPNAQAVDAILALGLFAIAPSALGGVRLRARAGPALAKTRALLATLWPDGAPLRALPAGITDDRLIGGLDLAASLTSGRPVFDRGALAAANGGALVAPMAERLAPELSARLAAALDHGEVRVERDGFSRRDRAAIGLVLIDEGVEPEEHAPTKLTERLAFDASLDGLRAEALDAAHRDLALTRERIAAARALFPGVVAGAEDAAAFVSAGAALGVASLRAPLLALAAARAAAALDGRRALSDPDRELAARLVLAPRATQLPAPPETADAPETDASPPEPAPTEPDRPPDIDSDATDGPSDAPPEPPAALDIVLAAAAAALPPEVLAASAARAAARSAAARDGASGARRRGTAHGRPLPPRPGPAPQGARLDLVATLRAAAPWTPLRRRERARAGRAPRRVEIRAGDLKFRRRETQSESLTLFVVDASGSAAAQRLAEAKGAVELLLAESYSRRDHVALISFRGLGAETLLPPTRALARAKRSLAGLPGGGPTPLAAGIDLAVAEAVRARRDGRTPTLVFLTDGQANVRRDGGGGRREAMADALNAAQRLRSAGLGAIMLDVSPRPRPAAREIAEAMGARYAPLPRADAARLSREIAAAGEGG